MAPLTLGENGRVKFSGDISKYYHEYRYRQRIFLPRNINAVLEANEAVRLRRSDATSRPTKNGGATSTKSVWPPCQRRKKSIREIADALQPYAPVPGSANEARLKITITSIKRTSCLTPRQRNAGSPCLKPDGISFRCRIKLTVWYLKNGTASDSLDHTHQLLCETEMCTITYDSDTVATVHMDDWFVIKAGQLCTMLPGGLGQPEFRMADGYRYEIRLSAVDGSSEWPPLTNRFSSLGDLKDPFKIDVVTRVDTSGNRTPRSFDHKAFFEGPGITKIHRANIAFGVEFGWCQPADVKPACAMQRASLVNPCGLGLPTPSTEIRELEGSQHNLTTLMSYTFLTPVEKHLSWYGAVDSKGQHQFFMSGVSCCFCDGRAFPSCTYLHFHFLTAHEMLYFKVRRRKPMSGIRSGDQNYEQVIEVSVDLAKDPGYSRPSNDAPDPRALRWIRPTKNFDVNRILKGDWSWLNEKKGLVGPGYRRTASDEPSPPPPPKKIDWSNIPDVGKRERSRFVVRRPRHIEKEKKVYLRTRSKRYVDKDEVLSDSDDDVDEGWLIQKLDETINDFEDISTNEETFMKLWDKHMFEERIMSHCQFGPSLFRFAKKHRDLLRSGPLFVEFWKHCLNQIQLRIIDTEVLRVVMELVKGGKEDWSSFGKSQVGLGLQGQCLLDEPPHSPPASPTPGKRRSSSRRSGRVAVDDPMDIDEPPSKPTEAQALSSSTETSTSGICTCGGKWSRNLMVLCEGKDCKIRWFHRSCFQLDRWKKDWTCPSCSEQ